MEAIVCAGSASLVSLIPGLSVSARPARRSNGFLLPADKSWSPVKLATDHSRWLPRRRPGYCVVTPRPSVSLFCPLDLISLCRSGHVALGGHAVKVSGSSVIRTGLWPARRYVQIKSSLTYSSSRDDNAGQIQVT